MVSVARQSSRGPWRPERLALALAAGVTCLCGGPTATGEDAQVYRVHADPLTGEVRYDAGTWRVGGKRLGGQEILLVRFSAEPPPARLPAGVFVRNGSLLTGTLETLIGDAATVCAAALDREVKLKREDLAGAFYALPFGEPENLPALARYARVLAVLTGAPPAKEDSGARGLSLQPGRRNRVTYANLDGLNGRLVRLGPAKALIELLDGSITSPDRKLVRLIELQTAPPPEPSKEDRQAGPEVVARLKSGDVLRGRIEKLDADALVLKTAFAGTLKLPRETLAVLYPAGGPGRGREWLSALKPAKSQHTPTFDAVFPARMDLSCDGELLSLAGLPCDRGLGVHSRSELVYALESIPGRSFVALVGIDDETGGRGEAEARVLLDGREVWKSGPLRPRAAPKRVTVPLATARQLALSVDFGPDGDDSGDHVDWGWAAIVGP